MLQIETQKTEINELGLTNETLTSKNKDLDVDLKQKTEKCNNLENQKTGLDKELTELRNKFEEQSNESSEKISQLEFELREKDKQQELNALETQLEETKTTMNQEKSEISEQLQSQFKIITDLQQNLSGRIGVVTIQTFTRKTKKFMRRISRSAHSRKHVRNMKLLRRKQLWNQT